MSTYLVAFVVGEYDYVEKSDPDGVRVRVYTAVGKKEQGRFALDVREIALINCLVFFTILSTPLALCILLHFLFLFLSV